MEKDVELFRGIFNFVNKPPKPPHFDEIVLKFKFNAMKLIENKSVVLSWVYLQPFCSTTKNTSVNEFVNKPSKRPIDSGMLRPWQRTINLTVNAMKLIEKDVELFWGYLYPFCSTFFTFFT